MSTFKIVVMAVMSLVLFACGSDKTETSAETKAAPAAETAMMETSSMASGTIDHSRDVAEFELRRSIGGVERMIEQYKADGYPTDELEAQKSELSANLDALLGG